MSKKKPTLYLIDGHALAYRAYFALTRGGDVSRFITSSGEPTAGTFGFISVLLKLLETEAPEYLAVSFDTGGTFRDEIYPEYKGTRAKMPEDLRTQIARIRELVAAFGIPVLEAEGYEADDVLGTVARVASDQGVKVVILTGDRDLLQLASKNVTIRLAGQKLAEAQDFGPQEVRDKYQLSPAQLIELKALVGDTSDNIPGVRGIGEKTAVQLLEQFGDLAGIYAHLEEVPNRFRSKLEQEKEAAELSHRLGTIVTDVPLEFELEACRAQEYDLDRIAGLFRDLEFRTLLNRITKLNKDDQGQQLNLFVRTEPSAEATRHHIVSDAKSLEALARRLKKASAIAMDVETTSTDPMRAELVGISLAVEPGEGYYLPVGHLPAAAGGPQLELEATLDALRRPLTDPAIPKVGHNLEYDYTVLARLGLAAQPLAFDTMIAEWLCNPASHNLGLKNLAWVRLGVEMTEISQLIGTGKSQRSMAEVPIAEVAPYASADAEVCLRLKAQLEPELEQKGQLTLFHELEMPLVPVLAHMEMAGVLLDLEFLGALSEQLARRLAELEKELYRHVGHPFNLNSTQQLSDVLFGELGLKPPEGGRKTASGHFSTAAPVLEALREDHPVVSLILEQRELSKLKSTYADTLPQQVNPVTGRVHTSYSQTGSVTGRLASSEPNLQNIPIRTELGREIRRAFVAAPGHLLLSVDYSQIELRIVAHMAGDKAMIKAFKEDQDIHSATAAAVFGVDPEQINPEMRRRAKAVNFGLIYGMTPFGLTRATDFTLAEAEEFVKVYFERFPGVRRYLDEVRVKAAEAGYVETLLGRRRYFPEFAAGAPHNIRARAEREATNSPIQGTAADIIKRAMLGLPQALQEAGLAARMLLQVHDELVFECLEEELPATSKVAQRVMQEALKLKVPLKTDAKAGRNWAEMTAVD
ncbi:MAG TPA: DNA polymerase I [Anaerolineales bacterium]|nr:DNA polymerase I [Anaerolineales bacterium]